MSYDLYFLVPAGRDALTRREFESWFGGRPGYRLARDEAAYENEETGVYFSFYFSDEPEQAGDDAGDEEEAPDDDLGPAGVTFNLNYNRPTVFALEAAPEIAALVDRFGLLVEGTDRVLGRGPFTAEGFLDGWQDGNRFGIYAVTSAGQAPTTAPAATIRQTWEWNRQVAARQAELGPGFFVPRISFARDRAGDLVRFVTWLDGIPTALPVVDWLMVGRTPRGGLRHLLGRRDPQSRLVTWHTAAEMLPERTLESAPVPHLLVRHLLTSAVLDRLFNTGVAEAQLGLEFIPFDHVIEAEELASALARPLAG